MPYQALIVIQVHQMFYEDTTSFDITQIPVSSILTVLGIANHWFYWRIHSPDEESSAHQIIWCSVTAIQQPDATGFTILSTGNVKTWWRSHPYLAEGRCLFTSLFVNFNQKIGLTALPIWTPVRQPFASSVILSFSYVSCPCPFFFCYLITFISLILVTSLIHVQLFCRWFTPSISFCIDLYSFFNLLSRDSVPFHDSRPYDVQVRIYERICSSLTITTTSMKLLYWMTCKISHLRLI